MENINEIQMCEYSGLPNVKSYQSNELCAIHNIKLNEDGLCSLCIEKNNK